MVVKYCDRCSQKIENDVYKVRFYGESGDNNFGTISMKTAEINCYSNLVDNRDYCVDCLTAIRKFAYMDTGKRYTNSSELNEIQKYQTSKNNLKWFKKER